MPAEGLLQNSAPGKVSPALDLCRQTDRQHSHEHEKYTFTALFGCALVREDPMEVVKKPCSDNPWSIDRGCIIEIIYKSYI